MNEREFMLNIYDKVSSGEPDVKQAEKEIGEMIVQMTDECAARLSEEDRQLVRDMLYSVQTAAMREGYILGAKHAICLFAKAKS